MIVSTVQAEGSSRWGWPITVIGVPSLNISGDQPERRSVVADRVSHFIATTLASAPTTSTAAVTTTTRLLERAPDDGLRSDRRTLVETRTIWSEDLSPKSIVYVPGGRFFAQNMMYHHTVTVYDRAGNLVRTIPDGVRLILTLPEAASTSGSITLDWVRPNFTTVRS